MHGIRLAPQRQSRREIMLIVLAALASLGRAFQSGSGLYGTFEFGKRRNAASFPNA
jgi:hypothetical protein